MVRQERWISPASGIQTLSERRGLALLVHQRLEEDFSLGEIVGRYKGVDVWAHSRWDISPTQTRV